MINKKNFKRITIAGTLAFAIISFNNTSAFAFTPIGEHYHTPTDKNECEWFEKENVMQENNLQVNTTLEEKVQAPLIKYNSDKLKKAKGKYDDGLRHIYTNPEGDQWNMGTGGSHYVAGEISLTSGEIAVAMAPEYGASPSPIKDYNVYGLSQIANDYAHECGHWWYDDPWLKAGQDNPTDAEQMQQELRADAFGIRIVENVPQFSVGGDLIAIHKLAMDKGWYTGQGVHPTAHDRWDKTYGYIKESSNYRVSLYNDSYGNNVLDVLDSKKQTTYETTVVPQYDPQALVNGQKKILRNAVDRTYYVAGQVAWAIKNKVWKDKTVNVEDAHKYFKDFPYSVPVKAIVAKASKNKWKIIDWYVDDLNGDKGYLTKDEGEALYQYLGVLLSSLDDIKKY